MRLEKASAKAIRYAIMNWHYSKSVPLVQIAYAVFNDKKEWCGVICYSIGANNSIAKPYDLQQGQVIELVRVALNGKQESTSKAVSISLKLVKKDAPNVKLIVSYADTEQGHAGTIYQATNWYYTGSSNQADEYIVNGKRMHGRTWRSIGKPKIDAVIKGSVKLRYIYPLDKTLIPLCKSLSKPYPKNAAIAQGSASDNQSEGGDRIDLAAQNTAN